MKLSPENIADINAHAIRDYPNESCGLIVDGIYVPCFNYASEPSKDFSIAGELQIEMRKAGKIIEAVVHSHPDGPLFPSELDMRGQIDTALPWVLVATDGDRVSPPEVWGSTTPVAPIIGRSFMHGIRDCYSLVRDIYGLGKDELAKQGIIWPFDPIELKDWPRADGWWGDLKKPGKNLYADNFAAIGFTQIPREGVRPGDGFMMKIRSENLNHAGVLCGDQFIIHHLPGRLSRREPAGIWARAAEVWVRHNAS